MLGVLKRKSMARVTIFALLLTMVAWMVPANMQEARAAAEDTAAELNPKGVYEAMITLQDQDAYKEGTVWTNEEPYSDAKGYYHWKGGPLGGANISAVGCVAFAFILSDAAFDSLPARMYAAGNFKFEDIKVGDILRVNNDVHTVIVLEVSDAGVVVAEGNISTGDHQGKVHWGRAISREEVMRSTSHYITRYPEGYITPEDPTANDIIGKGILEGGLTWKLTKAGTITISGNGAMPDFSSAEEQPWKVSSSQIRKVVIEDGVTSIGACAFWNCGLLSAELSSSVAAIGNSAFRGSSIISAAIPASVKTIGDSAFCGCQSLSSVTVSEGVETIGQNAFQSCTSLTSIALPASIGEVGAAAFFQCQKLTNVTFAPGSKPVKLGDNLFTQCYYLMRVTLPKSIDCIGDGMFQNCLMLAGVEIPQGAESIGGSAFASSAVSVVIIPDSVRTIGTAAFASCPLADIYFTGTEAQWNSISKMGDTAQAVSKATIHYNYVPGTGPDPMPPTETAPTAPSVTPTKPSENPTVPSTTPTNPSVTPTRPSITPTRPSVTPTEPSTKPTEPSETPAEPSAEPEDPIVPTEPEQPTAAEPTEKPAISAPIKTGTVVQDKNSKASYVVTKTGSSKTVTYKTPTDKKKTSIVIPATVKIAGKTYRVNRIADNAFKNNTKIKNVKIGANVQSIGANAFQKCVKVTSITIPSRVTTIQSGAFANCRNLKSITIKTTKLSNKKVGAGAFKGTAVKARVKTPKGKAKIYKKLLQAKGLSKKAIVK